MIESEAETKRRKTDRFTRLALPLSLVGLIVHDVTLDTQHGPILRVSSPETLHTSLGGDVEVSSRFTGRALCGSFL